MAESKSQSNSQATLGNSETQETQIVNTMRLTGRDWLWTMVLLAGVLWVVPWLWTRWERLEPSLDYRIPYALSRDYWLTQRRLRQLRPEVIPVVGDSVIWGEYVRAEGTLTHFLNEGPVAPGRFSNAGVNGLFPLALEGLMQHYGSALRDRRVILHANLLWLSSPKADLQTSKEERFNHAELVPQFRPRIPCYRASGEARLTRVVERSFPFLQWVRHLQAAYFEEKSFLAWTLDEDPNTATRLPNAARNPWSRLTGRLPVEPESDPDRGVTSPRHRAWSTDNTATLRFEWVPLEKSMQWAAFQRLVRLLKDRGNDVLVIIGPFNEHMLVAENRIVFRQLRDGVGAWLQANQVPVVVPEVLPSEFYADGSHPLTAGYEMLARQIQSHLTFQQWILAK